MQSPPDLLDKLAARRRGPPAPHVATPLHIPPGPDVLDAEVSSDASSDVSGLTFVIEYEDAAGQPSVRRVTIKSTNGTHLGCFCHERRAHRTFRIDRIESITDITTGEVFEDVEDYLEGLDVPVKSIRLGRKTVRPPEHNTAMARIRDGARILMWFARVDGHVHLSELEAVYDYCMRRCTDPAIGSELTQYDEVAMESWVRRQYPDAQIVAGCIRRIVAAGSAKHQGLLERSITRLIEADAVITPEEAKAGIEYRGLVEHFEQLALEELASRFGDDYMLELRAPSVD